MHRSYSARYQQSFFPGFGAETQEYPDNLSSVDCYNESCKHVSIILHTCFFCLLLASLDPTHLCHHPKSIQETATKWNARCSGLSSPKHGARDTARDRGRRCKNISQTGFSPSVPTPNVMLGAAPDSNWQHSKKCRLPQMTQVISMPFHRSWSRCIESSAKCVSAELLPPKALGKISVVFVVSSTCPNSSY